MNNSLRPLLLVFLGTLLFSCSKDDNDTSITPPRDYAEQYVTDIANIEKFLQTHYMTVIENSGATNDMDVAYHEITDPATQPSIWEDSRLTSWKVEKHGITYKIYYLRFRQGSGVSSKSPCNVDRVLTSYRGEYIYTDATVTDETKNIKSEQFEEVIQPKYNDLTQVIVGWSEIFPQFKTGTYGGNPDGVYPDNPGQPTKYYDFGAGVMFIPSGLAYYNSATSSIPGYSPLIFSFKLYEVLRVDHDGDGIYSYQEDFGASPNDPNRPEVGQDGYEEFPNIPDGYVRSLDKGVFNPDDTDGDYKPDFLDTDDDGDYYTTRFEITKPEDSPGPSAYYPFDPIIIEDNLSTIEDESLKSEQKGIPDINGDGTTPTRLRRHRDKNAKPPYTEY